MPAPLLDAHSQLLGFVPHIGFATIEEASDLHNGVAKRGLPPEIGDLHARPMLVGIEVPHPSDDTTKKAPAEADALRMLALSELSSSRNRPDTGSTNRGYP